MRSLFPSGIALALLVAMDGGQSHAQTDYALRQLREHVITRVRVCSERGAKLSWTPIATGVVIRVERNGLLHANGRHLRATGATRQYDACFGEQLKSSRFKNMAGTTLEIPLTEAR